MNEGLIQNLNTRAAKDHLTVVSTYETWAFFGPLEPGFWDHFTKSSEWNDGFLDPLDRWSKRVIDAIARDMGGMPQYPFGEESPHNFFSFAMNASRTWQSPVGMLVHDTAGLMISYRGAIDFERANLTQNKGSAPCETCHQPCTTACPVNALTVDGYDTDACKAYLTTSAGSDCLNRGCRVRRACPVSQSYGRDPEQSGYHMQRFLG